jgi:hypothetical protein
LPRGRRAHRPTADHHDFDHADLSTEPVCRLCGWPRR